MSTLLIPFLLLCKLLSLKSSPVTSLLWGLDSFLFKVVLFFLLWTFSFKFKFVSINLLGLYFYSGTLSRFLISLKTTSGISMHLIFLSLRNISAILVPTTITLTLYSFTIWIADWKSPSPLNNTMVLTLAVQAISTILAVMKVSTPHCTLEMIGSALWMQMHCGLAHYFSFSLNFLISVL